MISIFIEDVVFKLHNKRIHKKWLHEIAEKNKKKVGKLNIIFCSDQYIQSLNKKFLKHDYCTDVISFDYPNLYSKGKIVGDIFISIDTVNINAQLYNVTFHDELLRVIAHGLLHLLAYKDCTKKQGIIMRKEEENAIILYKKLTNKNIN